MKVSGQGNEYHNSEKSSSITANATVTPPRV